MSRPSHVRHAVAALLTASDRHGWSIEEVDRGLKERGVKADSSSIFRALTHLERAGLLDRVELCDGKARYEAHQDHHEHIRCTGCNEIAPVPGCIITETETALAASTGYLVSGHRVVFEGLCPVCSEGVR
jgi:Fe2+ or Zn2+ uptake regulation protein